MTASERTQKATTSRRRKRAARAPKDVLVPVDPALKKRWDELKRALDEATERGMSAFDERWEIAERIVTHQPPLYVFGGYKNTTEFFSEAMKEDPRSAYRFMRVAKYASPAEEEKYGVSLLDKAIAYIETQHGPLDGPLPVAFERLKIPVRRNGPKASRASRGMTAKVLLTEATVEDLERATRAAKKRSPKDLQSPIEKAMVAALRGKKQLAGIRVRARAGGAKTVSFLGVPVEQLAAFAKIVGAVTLPTGKRAERARQ